MSETLRSLLPALYHPLLPEFFDTPAPVEGKATCSSCAMCPPAGVDPAQGVTYFRPDTKCCTYQPRLPNYLVGAILADERPDMQEGRRRIRAQIAGRVCVTPRWLEPPRKQEVFLRASRRRAFGRSLLLRCPYFQADGGLCTIWRHREIVCSTFFCKYEGGADGERFWKSVRGLVGYYERALSIDAVRAIVPGYVEPPDEGMTLEDLEDQPPSDADYTAAWGTWAGREEELYLRTYEWVTSLDPARFDAAVAGPIRDERFAGARAALDALGSTALPERLMPNPDASARRAEGGVLVTSYSPYEPLLLTEALYDVVRAFGPSETVAEVRDRLRREADLEIPDELLVSLHRFRVLVAATPA